jgi:methylglutamate dehydrogenase subunit C
VETDEPVTVAGSAAGVWDHQQCLVSGRAAGARAARALGGWSPRIEAPRCGGWTAPIRPLYEIRVPGRKLKSFVDIQHDVTTADVRLAHREGFVSVEHLKRYTTLGMANDQGKMGNIIGLALMAEARGVDIPEVGTTTFRPPYTPVSIGALRGRSVGAHFKPLRRTPMHDWNLEHGAVMTEAGLWQRPWYFPLAGENLEQAYKREAETVRSTVGLCDVTSLGKIAVQGPDAATFLNRVYANAFAKLAVGKARYGIMLRDDGIVMDDGTTWRLSETEFFMTTTTAHAAQTMAWLEELLQVRWPELKVHVTSVSEQWGGVAVAGPESREVLRECVADPARVDNEQLPFMGVVETALKDEVPCRIARISFSGERAYEVYFPAGYAVAAMDRLWESAKAKGGCLYGLEALGALRVEKGHVTHAELDGRMTMDDAGLGKMASSKKPYIGKALKQRSELVREDRPKLVGIVPKDRNQTFNAGAVICAADRIEGHGEGWITAVTHSPELGHWMGIGYVNGGHEYWEGKALVAADPVRKGNTDIEVVSPHMVDPDGERMRG